MIKLLKLGVDFSLPGEQWLDPTRRIEEILGGQQFLFKIRRKVDKLGQEYASRIVLYVRMPKHLKLLTTAK